MSSTDGGTPALTSYTSDAPWSPGKTDQLARTAYATRIADTLANTQRDAGIVLGLYGKWGEGKTSLLNMVAARLAEHENTALLWFNPWNFKGPDALLSAFFAALAGALGKKLGSSGAEFKRVLTKYSGYLSAVPLPGVNLGDVVKAAAGQFDDDSLQTLRGQLEHMLAESKLRIVVFIDDVDRLERNEVRAVFKMVKLSAGFPGITYVLAFDQDMVAAALGDDYGGGGTAEGHRFLEKIVQVDLHLPPVPSRASLTLVLEDVQRALDGAGVTVEDQDVRVFSRYFHPLFLASVATLRPGKRYANALQFALPLVKGEVNVVDHLLLEAIRSFHPQVFAKLQSSLELLVSAPKDEGPKRESEKVQALAILEGAPPSATEAVRDTLSHLFPHLGARFSGRYWNSSSEDQWESGQRAASAAYVERYFQLGVQQDDVSDRTLTAFLDLCNSGKAVEATTAWRELFTVVNAERVIGKLRHVEASLTPTAASTLVTVLGTMADSIPERESFFEIGTPTTQAAILAAHALRRVPKTERRAAALTLLGQGTSLPFALECFRYIRHRDPESGESERERLLSIEDERAAKEEIAQRLDDSAAERPLYFHSPASAQSLLIQWHRLGDAAQVSSRLEVRFAEHPEEVETFLLAFVSTPLDVMTGILREGTFSTEAYDIVQAMIAPEKLLASLSARYGAHLGKGASEYANVGATPEERVSNRFAYLHSLRSVGSKPVPKESLPDGEGSTEDNG